MSAQSSSSSSSGRSFSAEDVLFAAKWLRDNKKAQLKSLDGVTHGRRVEYFKGNELVDSLVSGRLKDPRFSDLSREQASEIGQQMVRQQLIHRSELIPPSPSKVRRAKVLNEEIVVNLAVSKSHRFEDSADALYSWILPQSKTSLLIQSSLLLALVIGFCLIKVWPLWLKIAVWWMSTSMLVIMSAVFGVRLLFAALFWVVGLKGLWLLPNVFDDDVDFADAFTPLIGYGVKSKQHRQAQKEKEEREKEAAKARAEGAASGSPPPPAKSSYEFNFGLINAAVILIIGLVACNQMGLFMGENIPDFVISQKDLFRHFPALGSPEHASNDNDTVINDASSSTGADHEEEEPEIPGMGIGSLDDDDLAAFDVDAQTAEIAAELHK